MPLSNYGMNRQGLYPQEETRKMGNTRSTGTQPFGDRRMNTGGVVSSPSGHKVVDGYEYNTSRENRLEELGRVDAEKGYTRKGKRNLKSEKKRIVKELS
tara:strand:+ start:473 stop:769 length:297 start_codon:yes stop_codon:yes gene_type:complete